MNLVPFPHSCGEPAPRFLLAVIGPTGKPVFAPDQCLVTTKDFVVGFHGVPVTRLSVLGHAANAQGPVTHTLGVWLAN